MKIKEINNNIQETYVEFETAKLLKEFGFDCKTNGLFYNNKELTEYSNEVGLSEINNHFNSLSSTEICSAPTQQLTIDWLFENFYYLIYVKHYKQNWYSFHIQKFIMTDDGRIYNGEIQSERNYGSIEEAKEEAILYTLNTLIK